MVKMIHLWLFFICKEVEEMSNINEEKENNKEKDTKQGIENSKEEQNYTEQDRL